VGPSLGNVRCRLDRRFKCWMVVRCEHFPFMHIHLPAHVCIIESQHTSSYVLPTEP